MLWWQFTCISIRISRRVGKRKAVLKADHSGKRKAKVEKRATKDPNKPKRPPSAFFVFLYVSFHFVRAIYLQHLVILVSCKLIWLMLLPSEEFRKTFKKENPNVKAVSAVSICSYFEYVLLIVFILAQLWNGLLVYVCCTWRLEKLEERSGNPWVNQ